MKILISIFLILFFAANIFGQDSPCDKLDKFKKAHSSAYGYFIPDNLTVEQFAEFKQLNNNCDEYNLLNQFQNPDGATSLTILGGITSVGQFTKPSTSILLKVPATNYITFNLFAGYVFESTNEIENNNWFQTEVEVTTPDEFNCGLGFTFYLTNK